MACACNILVYFKSAKEYFVFIACVVSFWVEVRLRWQVPIRILSVVDLPYRGLPREKFLVWIRRLFWWLPWQISSRCNFVSRRWKEWKRKVVIWDCPARNAPDDKHEDRESNDRHDVADRSWWEPSSLVGFRCPLKIEKHNSYR